MDFAVAWGKMSDQAILDKVRFGHLERYAYYGWSGDMKLSENYLATHFANMHLIPFDKAVEKDLVKVRDGEFIRMRGFLVEVRQGENFTWKSSLRRDDTENGACEVMLVKSVEHI
jgi:hypothetical protein